MTYCLQSGERCPYCGSCNISKHGVRITLDGKKPRYRCKECRKTFYSLNERRRLLSKKLKRERKMQRMMAKYGINLK